ncbi:MAG: hypothetical protein AAGF07_04520 [Patescibacteria group bacterium]
MSDFIHTRSLLADNVENLLENISIRRNDGKNTTEDLFGDSTNDSTSINWILKPTAKSKIEVLMQEKESLGLYVSGHPLDDYKELLEWCRNTSSRDDIFIILIDKVKKIFTKSNSMMFVLQISVPDLKVEGIIFPKNALRMSPLLEEKRLYWIKGRVQQNKKSKASKIKKLEAEAAEEDVSKSESELKEYNELPKLVIDDLISFENGILPLFESEEIPIATHRVNTLQRIDWNTLLTNPSRLQQQTTAESPHSKSVNTVNHVVIFLPNSIGNNTLKKIKSELKPEKFTGGVEIKVEVEDTKGNIKKVKGTYWTTPEIVREFNKG